MYGYIGFFHWKPSSSWGSPMDPRSAESKGCPATFEPHQAWRSLPELLEKWGGSVGKSSSNGVYPRVINRGWLENGPCINDVPIEKTPFTSWIFQQAMFDTVTGGQANSTQLEDLMQKQSLVFVGNFPDFPM